jgi:hypothetical protein
VEHVTPIPSNHSGNNGRSTQQFFFFLHLKKQKKQKNIKMRVILITETVIPSLSTLFAKMRRRSTAIGWSHSNLVGPLSQHTCNMAGEKITAKKEQRNFDGDNKLQKQDQTIAREVV